MKNLIQENQALQNELAKWKGKLAYLIRCIDEGLTIEDMEVAERTIEGNYDRIDALVRQVKKQEHRIHLLETQTQWIRHCIETEPELPGTPPELTLQQACFDIGLPELLRCVVRATKQSITESIEKGPPKL